MLYSWLFCEIISTIIILSNADSGELDPEDAPKTCSKTLSVCTLTIGDENLMLPPKLIKGLPGIPGLKGEPGKIGPLGVMGMPGPIGRHGLPGTPGIPGRTGMIGRKGDKGDEGIEGITGMPGPSGMSGITGPRGSDGERGDVGQYGDSGEPGSQGDEGNRGELGDAGGTGEPGKPGPYGPPGPPGKPGTCPCHYETSVPGRILFGSHSEPSAVVCKGSTQDLVDGEYYMGPGPIKVKCVTRKKLTTLTCIPPLPGREVTYNQEGWLGMNIKETYGINKTQLNWLQRNSDSAFQTIRYHCLNSSPFPRDDVDKSLLILTWNDNTIGPIPTLTNPNFYSIDPESDGCSKSPDKWSYTDIKLVSDTAQRVPAMDFYIRDVREGEQSVKIEHVELCFD